MITFHQYLNVKTVTANTLDVSSTESMDLVKAYADTEYGQQDLLHKFEFTQLLILVYCIRISFNQIH